jgi:hypothetical protein
MIKIEEEKREEGRKNVRVKTEMKGRKIKVGRERNKGKEDENK